jgi:hypothetical protein
MKKFLILFVVTLFVANIHGVSRATNEVERAVILRRGEGLTVFTDRGSQIIIGCLETNTCVLIRRDSTNDFWVEAYWEKDQASLNIRSRTGLKELVVVDQDGNGIPQYRRIMEDGKPTGFELFVNGHFVKPTREGDKWIAEGHTFICRNGKFEEVQKAN